MQAFCYQRHKTQKRRDSTPDPWNSWMLEARFEKSCPQEEMAVGWKWFMHSKYQASMHSKKRNMLGEEKSSVLAKKENSEEGGVRWKSNHMLINTGWIMSTTPGSVKWRDFHRQEQGRAMQTQNSCVCGVKFFHKTKFFIIPCCAVSKFYGCKYFERRSNPHMPVQG